MKTIIAGSRGLSGIKLVAKAIADAGWILTISEVVSGTAPGIDRAGERWAETNQVSIKRFSANWDDVSAKHEPTMVKNNRYGKPFNALAGHNRNERMADYADALLAIWDGVSTGTADMIKRARKAGLKVHVYTVSAEQIQT